MLYKNYSKFFLYEEAQLSWKSRDRRRHEITRQTNGEMAIGFLMTLIVPIIQAVEQVIRA